MRGRKCWVFEGGYRNSCFIHWPEGGLKDRRDVDALRAHIDLLPTLVDLCGITDPKVDFDGRNMASLPTGRKKNHEDDRMLVVHNQ